MHICDIDGEALEGAIKDKQGLSGTRCDVGNATDVARLFEDVEVSLGGLDILVNNAGIGGGHSPIEEIDLDEWRRLSPLQSQMVAIQSGDCVVNDFSV